MFVINIELGGVLIYLVVEVGKYLHLKIPLYNVPIKGFSKALISSNFLDINLHC